jgi:hypothetical protein
VVDVANRCASARLVIFNPLRDRLEQRGACDRGIGRRTAETERPGPDRMQLPARAEITAGEPSDLVTQVDEFVGQLRNHPLCPGGSALPPTWWRRMPASSNGTPAPP